MDEPQDPSRNVHLEEEDIKASSDTFPFLPLPNELQIEVLKQHFGQYNISLVASINIFSISFGTEVFLRNIAAGSHTALCVLWSSPDIHAQALKALHDSFQGKLELRNFINLDGFRALRREFGDPKCTKFPPLNLVKSITIRDRDFRGPYTKLFSWPWIHLFRHDQ